MEVDTTEKVKGENRKERGKKKIVRERVEEKVEDVKDS